jgi:hypothetical protein
MVEELWDENCMKLGIDIPLPIWTKQVSASNFNVFFGYDIVLSAVYFLKPPLGYESTSHSTFPEYPG